MRIAVLRVVLFRVHFLIRFWFDHKHFSVDNAHMNALYTGSLRIKLSYFYPEKSNIL